MAKAAIAEVLGGKKSLHREVGTSSKLVSLTRVGLPGGNVDSGGKSDPALIRLIYMLFHSENDCGSIQDFVMSLKPQIASNVPNQTRSSEIAAFPKSCASLRIGDVLGCVPTAIAPRAPTAKPNTVQTALRKWAYACFYWNSAEREQQLDSWFYNYRFHRPH